MSEYVSFTGARLSGFIVAPVSKCTLWVTADSTDVEVDGDLYECVHLLKVSTSLQEALDYAESWMNREEK